MSKLRESARGADCQVRIPGVCNFNPETTVLAHIAGGGMGMKQHDLFAAFACSACHDAVDHRGRDGGHSRDELAWMHSDGVFRTQQIWLEKGLIKI